ncbi:hypothetical protein U9M48_001096 [Paspalum notatum var. saurae]|uniref:TFIIS-type domain-containing protein n=1 Tax=Paspalum notatum var. saurae TaxID=547442 RepID=A0AAQ3PFX6_PASNO
MLTYPMLYRVVRRKNVTVDTVLSTVPLNVSFRRALIGEKLIAWHDLEGCVPRKNLFRALKVPLKIKIFLWFLKRGVVLTKDNLAKRQWKDNLKCSFCNANETLQHLFFDYHVARNDMVFNRFLSNSFKEIMFKGIYWICCWANLSTEDDKEILEAGCRKSEAFVLEYPFFKSAKDRFLFSKLYTLPEVADSNCMYRNVVDHAAGEFAQVLFEDVASDPTLPRIKSVRCAACGHGEAVFYQVSIVMHACTATGRGEEGMTLFFVCCNPNCGHRWRD